MAVFCDACETKVRKEVSKCCNADVWAEWRAMSQSYICKECNDDCEVV